MPKKRRDRPSPSRGATPQPNQAGDAPLHNRETVAPAQSTISVGTGITIQAIALRKLNYRELPPPSGTTIPSVVPTSINLAVEMTGTINVYEDNLGELLVDCTVRPDLSVRPLEISATISALFRKDPQVPNEQMLTFLNTSASRLLFPYVRETISSVTGRGVFGPIFINPLLIGSLLSDEKLQELIVAQPDRPTTPR